MPVFSSSVISTSPLWAVTTYFNPAGYRSRFQNYHLFRKHLPVPLLTMALEYHPEPELQPGDADILVRIREGDVMWQKERLFNEALRYLPPHCTKVLFLDADVIFPDPNWVERVDLALDRALVVQPFSGVANVYASEVPEVLRTHRYQSEPPYEVGSAFLFAQGQSPSNRREKKDAAGKTHILSSPGIAWATNRAFIEEVRFFDRLIIGSGDIAFWSGVSGDHGNFLAVQRPEKVMGQWKVWAERARALAAGSIGYVDAWVLNLMHGTYKNRRYSKRWLLPIKHHFDPEADLRIGGEGAWLWNSNKPELHQGLVQYFKQRQEDQPVAA